MKEKIKNSIERYAKWYDSQEVGSVNATVSFVLGIIGIITLVLGLVFMIVVEIILDVDLSTGVFIAIFSNLFGIMGCVMASFSDDERKKAELETLNKAKKGRIISIIAIITPGIVGTVAYFIAWSAVPF
jgi:hypothetical protein